MPKGWLLSIVVTLSLVACAELAARFFTAPLGENVWAYWDGEAVSKFEWYRHLAQAGQTPPAVVAGDSIAARNFDPAAFSATAGVASYNLGWPGMFPLALDRVVPQMLGEGTPPRYLIVLQSATSYVDDERVRRNEAGILSSIIARRAAGERITGDYLALARVYEERSALVSYWLKGEPLLKAPLMNGFMPHRHPPGTPDVAIKADDVPAGKMAPQRQAAMQHLIEVARRHGIRLVVVLSPVAYDEEPELVAEHRKWVKQLAVRSPDTVTVWDFSQTDVMLNSDYKDSLHFWREGAERFSRELGRKFRQEIGGS